MRSWKKRKAPGAAADPSAADDRPARVTVRASAFDRALGLLSRREHSGKELASKLKQRGYEKDETDGAIAKAKEREYQSDSRYAESVIRRRAAAGYGPRYAESELKSPGIDPRAHRDALDAIDWAGQATDALRKRGLPVGTREERAKATGYLARRGFDNDAIKAAAGAIGAEAALEAGGDPD